jgi:hypothetical protein
MTPKLILATIGIVCAVVALVVAHPFLLPGAIIFIGIAVIVP